MASGILGQSAPSATTNTVVYSVPTSTLSVVNINIVNRSTTTPVDVRVALAATITPQNSEFIEYDATIPAKGVLERTGLAMNASTKVIVYASTGNCSVSVYGLEQTV